jgi:hypothetical protein
MTDATKVKEEPLIHLRQALRRWRRDRGKRANVFRYDARYDGLPPLHIVFAKEFGPSGAGTWGRWVLSLGWTTKRSTYAMMLQRYAEGFELPPHTDGPDFNPVLLFELRRPRAGGVFSVAGPARSWLGGRVWRFDGGLDKHGFTKIEKGERVTLLFQRGRDRRGAPR